MRARFICKMRTRCSLAMVVLCCTASRGTAIDRAVCNTRFEIPDPGINVLSLNGVRLPDTCFNYDGMHEVFIIGDWGGLYSGDLKQGPVPADHRKSGVHKRSFVEGIDDRAQHAVRDRMVERAAEARPEYILNVGDNFYWGGVEMQCGVTRTNMSNFSWQWDVIFEDFYAGEGMDGVQWLGVLGNHDWGGFMYSNAWDQAILYTWKEPKNGKEIRWVTPALYWRSTVHYLDFSVDYFFLDSNIYDVDDPFEHMNTNICSYAHNPQKGGTGDCSAEGGPADTFQCTEWFLQLWAEQTDWLHLHLSQSQADWQVVVTHFPPSFDKEFWSSMTTDYGIDMFVTGHLHRQEVWKGEDFRNFLAPTVVVISGGGGGITSDYMPDVHGDNQYGYMRMRLSKDRLDVVNIMHTGAEGDGATVVQRPCYNCTEEHIAINIERYQNGLLERGRLGETTSTSSDSSTTTSTFTSTGSTFTTTVTISSTTMATILAKTVASGTSPLSDIEEVAVSFSSAASTSTLSTSQSPRGNERNHTLVDAASEGNRSENTSTTASGVSPWHLPWFLVFLDSSDGVARATRLVAAAFVGVLMAMCIITGVLRGAKRSNADQRGLVKLDMTRSPEPLLEEKTLIEDRDFF